MADPFKSTYAAHYRPPTPSGDTSSSPVKAALKRSNESTILGSTGTGFRQPASTFKTEYIRSYSPPRDKVESTSPTKSRNRAIPKEKISPISSSYSSPVSSSENVSTPSSNNNQQFYDPANTGVQAPVAQDQGNIDSNTANIVSGQYTLRHSRTKPPYVSEYNRAYSPPRDKIHLQADDSDGKLAETSYFPPSLYQGRHQHQLGQSENLGGTQDVAGTQNYSETQNLGGTQGSQSLGDTQQGLGDTQGTPTQGTPTSGSRGRGISGGGASPKSPYYKTEYVRQYSPPRSKKLKADNL